MAAIGILFLSCGLADGFYVYSVEGRLLDSSGQPIPEDLVALSSEYFSGSASLLNGYFRQVFQTGFAWGGLVICGIPTYQKPVPPKTDSVDLIVNAGETDQYDEMVAVSDEQQARVQGITRYVNLGDIYLDFSGPQSIAVDSLGNVYAADTDNHRIHKSNPFEQDMNVPGTTRQGLDTRYRGPGSWSCPLEPPFCRLRHCQS